MLVVIALRALLCTIGAQAASCGVAGRAVDRK